MKKYSVLTNIEIFQIKKQNRKTTVHLDDLLARKKVGQHFHFLHFLADLPNEEERTVKTLNLEKNG